MNGSVGRMFYLKSQALTSELRVSKQKIFSLVIVSAVFACGINYRTVCPEMWASRVKQLVMASYAERQKTEEICAGLQRLVREGMNEVWQHANVSTNAFVARVEEIDRDKAALKNALDKVSAGLRAVTSS
jgi:Tektin family